VCDLAGSLPTLVTYYTVYNLYYLKFLRFVDFNRASALIRHFVGKLDGACHFKKNDIQKG
jgi:hypothetical protein